MNFKNKILSFIFCLLLAFVNINAAHFCSTDGLTTRVPTAVNPWPSVDQQIRDWETVYIQAGKISDFSPEKTYLPALIGRVELMAAYVIDALTSSGSSEVIAKRVDYANGILEEAGTFNIEERLNLSTASRLFDALAMACDTTINLLEMVPKPISSLTLNALDVMFLCVPNGALKISRIVDGVLRERPRFFISLPNKVIAYEKAPHGGHVNNIYYFYAHDVDHAYIWSQAHVRWDLLWPEGYARVKSIRDALSPEEKNIVDPWLYFYFHEDESLVNGWYDLKKSTQKELEDTVIPLMREEMREITPFIDRMCRAGINPSSTMSLFPFIPRDIKSTIARKQGKDGAEIHGYFKLDIMKNGSIEEFEEVFGSTKTVTFAGVLKMNESAAGAEMIDVSVKVDDMLAEFINVELTVGAETYSYLDEGPQYFITNDFQDLLYLLRHAGRDFPERQVTLKNYKRVKGMFGELCKEAAEILKAHSHK